MRKCFILNSETSFLSPSLTHPSVSTWCSLPWQYQPLIGREMSRDLNTGLWLDNTDLTPLSVSLPRDYFCPSSAILASDWWILVTWPEYWHLIGQYWSHSPVRLTSSRLFLSLLGNTGLWLVNTGHVTWILASDWFRLPETPQLSFWSLKYCFIHLWLFTFYDFSTQKMMLVTIIFTWSKVTLRLSWNILNCNDFWLRQELKASQCLCVRHKFVYSTEYSIFLSQICLSVSLSLSQLS